MSTNLRWQSMDLMAKLMYPIIWRSVVMYNPKTRQLEYKLNSRQFLVYCVTEFYLLIVAGSLCPFIALTKYTLVPGMEPMPLENIIFLIGFGASCVFDSLITIVDLKVKDDICPAFNGLTKMEAQFESEMKVGKFNPAVDIVGYFLNGFVLVLYLIGWLMPLFVFRDMDLISYSLKDILPSRTETIGQVLHVLFIPFRIFTITYSYYAAVRVTITLFTAFVIGLKILLRCVDLLMDSVQDNFNSKRWAIVEALRRRKLFLKLQLVVLIFDSIVAPSATGIMSLGLVLGVTYNFATIRMYTIIPMPTFLYFPLIAVLVPLIAQLELPEGIRMFEGTSEVLRRWKRRLSSVPDLKGRSYLARTLQGTQPCKFHSGLAGFTFFLLKNSTKSTYYCILLDFTIDALMSIPLSAVENAF